MPTTNPGRIGRPCKTCAHEKHVEMSKGAPLLATATKYGLTPAGLWRHVNNCLKVSPAERRMARTHHRIPHPPNAPTASATTGQLVADAILPSRENLIGRLERLSTRVDDLVETARTEGRDGVALAGLSEIRKAISDIGRIAGLDRPSVAVQINNSAPTAGELSRAVLDLLRQHLPQDQQATLLPALAGHLKALDA